MRWVLRIALAAVAVVLTLSLAEGCFRLRGYRPFPPVTERSRFWEPDGELGWRHRPGHRGTFEIHSFRTRVSINRKGLRDEEHEYARTDDRRRLLVLGDSFVWGYGVEQTERFTEVLGARTGMEVINAGVSGYCTDQELLWLRREGVRYAFDHLLLVFTGDDHAQNHKTRVFYVYEKPRFVLEDGDLVLTNVPVPAVPWTARFAHWIRCRSALFNELTGQGLPRVPEGEASAEFPLTRAILREMRRLAWSKGAEMTIVLAARGWWTRPAGTTVEQFVETLRGDGFRVLDVEAAPGFDVESMVTIDHGHWNRAGHAFVAEMLIRHGALER